MEKEKEHATESDTNPVMTQPFWLGVTSALAVIFAILLIGTISGTVSFNQGKNGGGNYGAAAPTPGEPTPQEIVVAPVTKDDWVRGDRKAKVSVIEFSDIDCPFCGRLHDTMNAIITSDKYAGEVNWVYRHLPLPIHPEAEAKAIAAECVGELAGNDAFWAYLDGLFASQAADEVTAEAQKLGINLTAFEACRAEEEFAQKVAEDLADADAAGGRGTPYSVIVSGDETIPVSGAVPRAEMERHLDSILN